MLTPSYFDIEDYDNFLSSQTRGTKKKRQLGHEEFDLPEKKPDFLGLVNEGTTCYMNSLI